MRYCTPALPYFGRWLCVGSTWLDLPRRVLRLYCTWDARLLQCVMTTHRCRVNCLASRQVAARLWFHLSTISDNNNGDRHFS